MSGSSLFRDSPTISHESTMKKKILYGMMALFAVAIMSVSFTSCGDDEPDNPREPDNPDYPYNPGDPDDPDTSIGSIVKENVDVNCSYSDYAFTITFKSKLKSELPSAKIEYGVGHGDLGGTEIVSLGSDAYHYSSHTSGNMETITITNPFWFYFIFNERDDDKSSICEAYYRAYLSLKEKGYSNLNSEEKDLYREATKELDKCEEEAKRYYSPSAQVSVNNKFYRLKRYKIS